MFLATGDLGAAEVEFETAVSMARRIGNPPQLWKTLAAIGDLRLSAGRPAAAQQIYREALEVIEDVAVHLRDISLSETFLASSHIQRIRLAVLE